MSRPVGNEFTVLKPDVTSGGEDYVELSNNFRFDIHAGSDSDFVYIDSAGSDAAVGNWIVGALTGAQPFVDRVLYQAELTVTFAGFESCPGKKFKIKIFTKKLAFSNR